MPSRILIVDDEELELRAFERSLNLHGYNVWAARDWASAVSLAQEVSFDLIVLDFIMPGCDGVELLVRIRRHLPLVRSIIISGKVDSKIPHRDITKELGERVESDLYLHKPVSNEKLINSIKLLLADPRGGDWRSISAQLVRHQGMPIGKAKAAARSLKKRLKKRG